MDNEIKTEPRLENEGGEGNITVKRSKSADFVAKVICLVLAFFLWFYASSLDTVIYDEEFQSIPVEIENKSGFSLLSGDGMTVDVTLSGKRNALRNVNDADIRAYATVPEDAQAGRHELEIRFDVPSGVSFEKSSTSKVVVYIEKCVASVVIVCVYDSEGSRYRFLTAEYGVTRAEGLGSSFGQTVGCLEYVIDLDLF